MHIDLFLKKNVKKLVKLYLLSSWIGYIYFLLQTTASVDILCVKKCVFVCFQYFENYHGISAGDAALYVNGLPIDIDVYDMFTFLDVMRSEAKLMQGLFSLGFKVLSFFNDLLLRKYYKLLKIDVLILNYDLHYI